MRDRGDVGDMGRNGAGGAVSRRNQVLMNLHRPDLRGLEGLAWTGIRERKGTWRRGGVGVGTWMMRGRSTHGGRENNE